MEMSGHLLYIDITQICGIGCSFCMYADRHQTSAQFELSDRARTNISGLVNHSKVKRVSISGEGEPLNNVKVFQAILGLSRGNVAFEFITSGFLPHDQLNKFFDETETIVKAHGDTCNVRLSADSYHIEKIRHRPHGVSMLRSVSAPKGPLTFSFRSVDTDRAFTRSYLLDEAKKYLGKAEIIELSPLEDRLVVGERVFNIDYKSHVHPTDDVPASRLDLLGYIQAIESRIGKRFTFGSLNPAPLLNGLDLTIKPDGVVALYGIENVTLGNIHTDHFSWESLVRRVADDPLMRCLHTTPLLDVLARVGDQEAMQLLARKANNPYWLVKEVAKHPAILEQFASA